MRRTVRTALLFLSAFTLFTADAQQQPPPTTLRGTIHALEPKAGSIDIVTGVGMALRVVRVAAPSAARITAGASVAGLRRGDVVRVQCHWAGKQLVADRIEKVSVR